MLYFPLEAPRQEEHTKERSVTWAQIHPLPTNPHQPKKKASSRPKVPYHLTSDKGREVVAESDAKKKVKQVKALENKKCADSAIKRKKESDLMRRKGDREGDPMREKNYTLDSVKEVYGPNASIEMYREEEKKAKKPKVTQRTTTQRRPAALPMKPRAKKTKLLN